MAKAWICRATDCVDCSGFDSGQLQEYNREFWAETAFVGEDMRILIQGIEAKHICAMKTSQQAWMLSSMQASSDRESPIPYSDAGLHAIPSIATYSREHPAEVCLDCNKPYAIAGILLVLPADLPSLFHLFRD